MDFVLQGRQAIGDHVREIATKYDDSRGLRQEAIDRGSDGWACPTPEVSKLSYIVHDVWNAEPKCASRARIIW